MTQSNFPEAVEPPTHIIVYVCPAGCGHYYGAPNFRPDKTNLESQQSRRDFSGTVLTHKRIECPNCYAQGKTVRMKGYIVTQVVPLDAAVKAHKGKPEIAAKP